MEREYELMYIVRPDLDEDQVRTTMDEVTSMVAGRGGEIVKSSLWGRRRLAYLVGGFHDGYYVVADTRLPSDQLGEVERQLRLSENVIRHMLTIARPVRQEGERPARGRERWRDRERGRGRGRGAAAAEPGDGAGAADDVGDADEAVVAEGVSDDGAAAVAPSAPEAAEPEPSEAPADQPVDVEGPLVVEGSAAPAVDTEETDVSEASSGGVALDDEELDDEEDDLGDEEDEDDDDDEDA